jgi:predicted O-methyltransferase YrrM
MLKTIKRWVPVRIKQPIRDFIDNRSWRALSRLEFDATNLISRGSLDLAAAMNDPMVAQTFAEDNARIAEVYGRSELPAGVNPGDRRALYHLATYLKPRTILEVGTNVGASTIYLAAALKRFGGHVVTVDILDVNGPEGPWRHDGLSAPPAKLMRRLSLDVTFQTARALDMLCKPERFDMIFLDGDHRHFAVYREVSAALNRINPNGIVVLHDFYPKKRPLTPDGNVITGPWDAAERVVREADDISFLPMGELPWPTRAGGRSTSLALVVRK